METPAISYFNLGFSSRSSLNYLNETYYLPFRASKVNRTATKWSNKTIFIWLPSIRTLST